MVVAKILIQTGAMVALITVVGHFIGKLFKRTEEVEEDE